ncbi:MAG: response regulator transcription factor [Oligoflexia bacterium]|nr:response regulator transcription factor [Oligoflexia bacterium]
MKVLIIEDDVKISELLTEGFTASGYEVFHSPDGIDAQRKLQKPDRYDLIILDLMLPGISGFTLLKEVRKKASSRVPIIILSARPTADDRIAGLQEGADDYLVKPFSFPELLIRAQNLLRRQPRPNDTNFIEFEDLSIDLIKREVRRRGIRIELQIKEFSLLVFLLQNPGIVLSKTLLLRTIWGYDFVPQTNVVDVLVCRLRNKIDRDFEPRLIHTIRGLGYVCKKG